MTQSPVRITCWSLKGGVGKTTIALNLALHLGCGLITNERYTMLDKVLPKDLFLKLAVGQDVPQIPKEHSIIFDMGGYLDQRVVEALSQSNYVLIPTTSDRLDLQGAISTINEIQDINNNIIVIANKVEGDGDYNTVKELISQIGDYRVFPIKKSRSLRNIMTAKESVQSMQEKGGLNGYMLKSIALQFDEILDVICKEGGVK